VATLALALLFGLTESRLEIFSPEKWRSDFGDSEQSGVITASYSNFGYIPYGHQIMGKIFYDENNKNACNEFDEASLFGDGYDREEVNHVTPFVFAYRGECSFVRKARNIQNIGGSVAVIIDNKENENVNTVVMSNDGTGGGIKIPSMLISYEDGKALLAHWNRADESERNSAMLFASFDIKRPDNRVEYDIWYTSSNDRALDFIQEFSTTDAKFGDLVLMEPHFVVWKCPYCDEDYTKKECYGGGKYCAMEASSDGIMTG
jgi:hypothetical protein